MKAGLIGTYFVCCKCGENMRLCERKGSMDGFEWRCRKQGKVNAHDVRRSVRKGSWFSHSHLSMCDILRITRCWFLRMGNDSVMQEVKVHEHAVVDWFMFCREVCMTSVINDSVPIGGKGVIVEVDESKFGKMKYARGKHVDDYWVIGGIERGTNRCFFREIEDRSKASLERVIVAGINCGFRLLEGIWWSKTVGF
ncbi:hypothetical protein X975_17148, partial [Stegodyphus mimosarum]